MRKLPFETVYMQVHKLSQEPIDLDNPQALDDRTDLLRALVEGAGWDIDDFSLRMNNIISNELN